MDHRTECKFQNYKTCRRNAGENLGDFGHGDDFLDIPSKA